MTVICKSVKVNFKTVTLMCLLLPCPFPEFWTITIQLIETLMTWWCNELRINIVKIIIGNQPDLLNFRPIASYIWVLRVYVRGTNLFSAELIMHFVKSRSMYLFPLPYQITLNWCSIKNKFKEWHCFYECFVALIGNTREKFTWRFELFNRLQIFIIVCVPVE